jgi:hypothetical protein
MGRPIRPLNSLSMPPRPILKRVGSLPMGFKPTEVNSTAPSQVLPCHHGSGRSEDVSGDWQVVRRKRLERKECHPTPLGALLVLHAEISLKLNCVVVASIASREVTSKSPAEILSDAGTVDSSVIPLHAARLSARCVYESLPVCLR